MDLEEFHTDFFDIPIELQCVILGLAGPKATILTLSSSQKGLGSVKAPTNLAAKLSATLFGPNCERDVSGSIPRFESFTNSFQKLKYLIKYWKIDFARDAAVKVSLVDDPYEEEKPKFDGVLRLALIGPPSSGKSTLLRAFAGRSSIRGMTHVAVRSTTAGDDVRVPSWIGEVRPSWDRDRRDVLLNVTIMEHKSSVLIYAIQYRQLLCCYDATSRASFEKLLTLINDANRAFTALADSPGAILPVVVVISTHNDMKEQIQVEPNEGLALAERLGGLFFEFGLHNRADVANRAFLSVISRAWRVSTWRERADVGLRQVPTADEGSWKFKF